MERFLGSKKPSPQPRTKTGFADLLHELGCLYEKMIEQRREDVAKFEWLGPKDDPAFDVDCSRRANAFKIASKNISTRDAPEELTEDSLALYTNSAGINNSVIALMEEYITKGEIRLLHGLRAMTGGVDYQEGNVFEGFLNIMKGFHQGLVIGFKTLDLDEMDDAGEEYAGTEDEKDNDAKWFRGLSKAWRLKLKNYYDEQSKKSLREIIFGTDSTPAPGSEKFTAIMKRHDDFANELDEAEEMSASRRRVSLDLQDTLRVDLPCERDRNEAINEQDEIEQIQGSRRRVSLDL